MIEKAFARLKQFLAIATGCEKLKINFKLLLPWLVIKRQQTLKIERQYLCGLVTLDIYNDIDPFKKNEENKMSIFIRKNLSHLVEQELGMAIICGVFDFFEFPSEADLCKKYGVSRSAVREAVKMLSAKGLISSTQRIGIKILPHEDWNLFDPDLLNWLLSGEISIALLKEFLQMRISIEPEAAALATKNASEVQLSVIAEALAQLEATEQHSSEYLDALIDFHTGVLYATNNRFYIRLKDFISTALRSTLRSNSTNITSADSYNTGTVADYIKIFNSIKSGNHGRAKHLMMLLIDDSLSHIDFPTS